MGGVYCFTAQPIFWLQYFYKMKQNIQRSCKAQLVNLRVRLNVLHVSPNALCVWSIAQA